MSQFQGDFVKACSVFSLIYLVGFVVLALAPETKGKPLPDRAPFGAAKKSLLAE